MKRESVDEDQKDSKKPKTDNSDPQSLLEAKKKALAERMASLKAKATQKKEDEIKGKGGLDVTIHPLLAALNEQASTTVPIISRFSTVKANVKMVQQQQKKFEKKQQALVPKPEPTLDMTNILLQKGQPFLKFKSISLKGEQRQEMKLFKKSEFYDPKLKVKTSLASKSKTRKQFSFVPQGKYIQEANQIRDKIELDKHKEEIANQSFVDPFSVELQLVSVEPPSIEWCYDNLDIDSLIIQEGEDAIVTNLIQHPIPIEPPSNDTKPIQKNVMLTKKEQKKLRRLRRLEEQREKQDKIRMGLLPPPEPRVKIQNFMRVFTSEAIQDPTQIEAQVRKQMMQRQINAKKHDDEKRLTDEQRRDKKASELEEDISLGVKVAVFKIKDFSSRQNQFKVNVNAKQYNLTGVALFYHNMNLVIVEGGPKGIQQYKKLMLRRINWTNEQRTEDDEDEGEKIVLKSSINCALVWEGELKSPSFKYFQKKQVQTEAEAKSYLEKHRVGHYWDTAKTWDLLSS